MQKTFTGIALVALPLLATGCNEWAVGSAAANVAAAAIKNEQVKAQLAEAAAVDQQQANKALFTYSPEVEAQLKELRATMKEQQKLAAAQWKAAGIRSRTAPTTRPAASAVPGNLFR